jgi:hypothetical protein
MYRSLIKKLQIKLVYVKNFLSKILTCKFCTSANAKSSFAIHVCARKVTVVLGQMCHCLRSVRNTPRSGKQRTQARMGFEVVTTLNLFIYYLQLTVPNLEPRVRSQCRSTS